MAGGIVVAVVIGALFGNTTVERFAWVGAELEEAPQAQTLLAGVLTAYKTAPAQPAFAD